MLPTQTTLFSRRTHHALIPAFDSLAGERMSALGYGPLSDSNLAFACYAAVFLLSRLYLPVLLVFAGADVSLAYSFLTDTVLGDVGLPRVLAVVSGMPQDAAAAVVVV